MLPVFLQTMSKPFGTVRPILQIRILIGRGSSDRAKMVKYHTEEPIPNGKSLSMEIPWCLGSPDNG